MSDSQNSSNNDQQSKTKRRNQPANERQRMRLRIHRKSQMDEAEVPQRRFGQIGGDILPRQASMPRLGVNTTHILNPRATMPRPGVIVQPAMSVNAPNDQYEVEANHVADAVMRMPSGGDLSAWTRKAPTPAKHTLSLALGNPDSPKHASIPPLRLAFQRQNHSVARSADETPEVVPEIENRIGQINGAEQPLSDETGGFFSEQEGATIAASRKYKAKYDNKIKSNNTLTEVAHPAPDSPQEERTTAEGFEAEVTQETDQKALPDEPATSLPAVTKVQADIRQEQASQKMAQQASAEELNTEAAQLKKDAHLEPQTLSPSPEMAETTAAQEPTNNLDEVTLWAPVAEQQPDLVTEQIDQLASTPPSEFNSELETLRQELPAIGQQEQEALLSTLPAELPVPMGVPTQEEVAGGEISDDPISESEVDSLLHASPTEELSQQVPEGENKPLQNETARQTKVQQESRKADKQLQQKHSEQFVSQSHVVTSAGPRPKVDLSGQANPAQVSAQKSVNDSQVVSQKTKVENLLAGFEIPREQLLPPKRLEPIALDISLPTPPTPEPLESKGSSEPDLSGQDDNLLPTQIGSPLTEALAPSVENEVERMMTEYGTHRSSYQKQLQEVEAQAKQQFQAHSAELQAEHLIMQEKTDAEVALMKGELQTQNQGLMEDYLARSTALEQETMQFVTSNVQETERKVEQLMSQGEERAEGRKRSGQSQAASKVQAGQQKAGKRLAKVSLDLHGGYEASAVEKMVMRQVSEDSEAVKAAREALRKAREQAKQDAQAILDAQIALAEALLEQMKAEVEQIINQAQHEGLMSTVEVQNLIAAKLAEVQQLQNDLTEQVLTQQDTEAMAGIMRINSKVIDGMGEVFDLFDTHAGTRAGEFERAIANAYQETMGQYQAGDVYHIFVPALDPDEMSPGHWSRNDGSNPNYDDDQYVNMPFSQQAMAMMGYDQVAAGQMMYLDMDVTAAGSKAGGAALEKMMGTLSRLNPEAEFTLSGHSSGTATVAAAAHSLAHQAALGDDEAASQMERIQELMLFDPGLYEKEEAYNALPAKRREKGYNFYSDQDATNSYENLDEHYDISILSSPGYYETPGEYKRGWFGGPDGDGGFSYPETWDNFENVELPLPMPSADISPFDLLPENNTHYRMVGDVPDDSLEMILNEYDEYLGRPDIDEH